MENKSSIEKLNLVSPIVDAQNKLTKGNTCYLISPGSRKYLGSKQKSGWLNILKKHKDDYKSQIATKIGKSPINIDKIYTHKENQRKVDFQNFYKQVIYLKNRYFLRIEYFCSHKLPD